jgi:putative ABC transport system permease protein
LTIVGVIGDVRSDGLDRDAPPQMYRAMLQASSLQFALVVRGRVAPASIGPAIAREVRSIDADMPVYGVRRFEEIVEESIGQRRLAMQLLGVFAGAAVLLAAIGLYGVMSYYVGLRQRELGVRLAVGATPRHLSQLVLTRGVVLTVIGIAIGLAAAGGLSTLLRTLLYQLTPLDATTYAESAAVLALVALAACWLPARRAAAIDPIRTLRAD